MVELAEVRVFLIVDKKCLTFPTNDAAPERLICGFKKRKYVYDIDIVLTFAVGSNTTPRL